MARMDGSVIDVLFTTARPAQSPTIVWSASSTSTTKMRAQEALRDRERELSQLVDMVPSLLWRLTPEGEPIFFNKRMIDFLGLDVEDYDKPGMSRLAAVIEAVVHPDDAAAVGGGAQPFLRHRRDLFHEYRLRRADGVYRWMEGRAEPLRDESGRIVQWYGLSSRYRRSMRAEEALRERERSLWQLVETLPAMIDCAAPDGEPVYRNQQLARIPRILTSKIWTGRESPG